MADHQALQKALDAYRDARRADDAGGEATNGGNLAGDELANMVGLLLHGPCPTCGYPTAAYGPCYHPGTAWEGDGLGRYEYLDRRRENLRRT